MQDPSDGAEQNVDGAVSWEQFKTMEALMITQSAHDGHLIQLEALTRVYPTPAGPVTVLQDVNVNIAPGQLAAITGKSGSGKSTLLNLLTGIDRPTSGSVVIGGERHPRSERRSARRLARPEPGNCLPILSTHPHPDRAGERAPAHGTERLASLPAQRKARALALLEQVDIRAQANKFPTTLSGGQQQRAAIARALANDPALLVADEPTGNLNSQTAAQVFDLFRRLAAQGKTIVMVTHDRELAAARRPGDYPGRWKTPMRPTMTNTLFRNVWREFLGAAGAQPAGRCYRWPWASLPSGLPPGRRASWGSEMRSSMQTVNAAHILVNVSGDERGPTGSLAPISRYCAALRVAPP